METSRLAGMAGAIPAVEGLLLDSLAEPGLALSTDADVLDLLTATDRVVSLAEAARAVAIRAVEQREAAEREAHCTTPEHLRRSLGHTIQRSRSLVRDAVRQGRFPHLVEARAQGAVVGEQSSVIALALSALPDDLGAEEIGRAQETMIGFAAEFDPSGLARLGNRLIEVLAPERADELEAQRLEREEKAAEKNRRMSLFDDGHGTMHFKGRLPSADGEELAALLDAHAESRWKRHLDEEGADAGPRDQGQLLADALMDLVREHHAHQTAPKHGGDRPRVILLLGLTALIQGLGDMALGSGTCVSATEARRLACDCDLVPAVLNTSGVPLGLGRSRRLISPALRAALIARDRGCVFPGCDRGPTHCEAHHVHPWWAGGPTSLDNLVLLCPRHHRRVEPGRGETWDYDNPDRWQVRLGHDRLPEIIPPRSFDPARTALRHERFSVMRR